MTERKRAPYIKRLKRSAEAKKATGDKSVQARVRIDADHYRWLESKVEVKSSLKCKVLSTLINECITQARINEVKHLQVGPSQLHRLKAYLETQDLEEHKFAGAMLRLLTAFLQAEVHLM